mgnify:FL=1|jgi:hypothetical protein
MSLEDSTIENSQERMTFPELETDNLPGFNIFELIPNGQFSPEQVERIKKSSTECDNGATIYYDNLHIIFSFPNDDRLFLCLTNSDDNYHRNMWYRLRREFGEDLVLRDAGTYCIYEGQHIIRAYVSDGLSNERHEITAEQCYACRKQIQNMNLDIVIRPR